MVFCNRGIILLISNLFLHFHFAYRSGQVCMLYSKFLINYWTFVRLVKFKIVYLLRFFLWVGDSLSYSGWAAWWEMLLEFKHFFSKIDQILLILMFYLHGFEEFNKLKLIIILFRIDFLLVEFLVHNIHHQIV